MKSKILQAFLLALDHEEQQEKDSLVDRMVDHYCKTMNIDRSHLFVKSRKLENVRHRRLVANYLYKKITMIEISRFLQKDHSTTIHLLNTHDQYLMHDDAYKDMWNKL